MCKSLLTAFLFITALWGDEFSVDHATLSYYAVDLESGDVLASKNSDLSMIPASCMKIVTTAAALHLLGPDTHFATYLEYDGQIDKAQTLHGNITIRGGGDPTLGSLDWKKSINEFADAIAALGIRKIEGKIIADASLWEKAQAVPSWAWEDLGNYYGAGASALSFHDNSYTLTLKPRQLGEKAEVIRLDPPIAAIDLHNEATTGPEGSGDGICIYGSEYSPIRFIRGTIPLGVEEFTVKGSIPDPAALIADLFSSELQKRGIAIAERDMKGERTVFHTTHSPTVGAIVHQINQKSVNLYAEHLLKKMGGVQAITDFWRAQGLVLSGFNMADGSGLSRKNLITAKQLVAILLKMKDSSLFVNSLPEKEGGIRAKSGSMSLIRAYAGYSDRYAFAVIVNHCLDRQKLESLLPLFIKSLAPPEELSEGAGSF